MSAHQYDALAEVYEWLIPDDLLTPAGSAAVFAPLLELEPPARLLDCAAGTGQLAVGLAAMGFDVVAIDASPAMIERTRSLAAAHNVELAGLTCNWEQLPAHNFEPFDAVLCVGNSLAHAAGRAARRTALRNMAAALQDHGLLVVTSRNWENVRSHGSGLDVSDRTTERRGRHGLVIHGWTIPDAWEQPHYLDTAVALLDSLPAVTTPYQRLTLWPFTHQALEQDLQAAGLSQTKSSYTHTAERYVVTGHKTRKSPSNT